MDARAFSLSIARVVSIGAIAAIASFANIAVAGDPAVSFRNDVMAVLSKAGCNAGVCHGNKNGKGGFLLSLRGQDPERDFAAITRESSGRRIDTLRAHESLIVAKPAGAIAHGGGRRFDAGSDLYATLVAWLAAGARRDPSGTPALTALDVTPRDVVIEPPLDHAEIRAIARFSDGSERDVRALAVYEASNPATEISADGVVRLPGGGETTVLVRFLDRAFPVRLIFVRANDAYREPDRSPEHAVDRRVFAKLRTLRIEPAARCDDHEYVRRVWLDLTGRVPDAEDARRFVADPDPDKRRRLVDSLLETPEFAEFQALRWSDLLRNEEKVLDRKGVQAFHRWVRDSFAAKKPLDVFARELVAARGSTYLAPQSNYYRAMREPLVRAESTAQLFLGTRLQCAKCHNHPFDAWTQDDYYSWASVFAGVRYKIVENRRRDNNDKHEFIGEQIVWHDPSAELSDPRSGATVRPRFLGDRSPLAEGANRLEALARWLTSADNRQFARSQANRIWYQLIGVGIVDPIDDFRMSNPPSHPQLLEELTDELIASGFDVRHLVRHITSSETYQLSWRAPRSESAPAASGELDDATATRNFARASVIRLGAEQLLDSLSRVIGTPAKFDGYPLGTEAREIPGVRASRPRETRDTEADRFLRLFGKPPRLLACECERSQETTMGQAFQLISGETVDDLLTAEGNRIDDWIESGLDDRALVDEIFWTSLSRPPAPAEVAAFVAHLGSAEPRRAGIEDLVWSLVNSKEFLLRR